MEYANYGGWHWYRSGAYKIDPEKCGKWMYFFTDEAFAKNICKKAILEKVCNECKCSDLKMTDSTSGAICFYLNADDIAAHKRIITFMILNNLIQKTKAEKFKNISFKYDTQTRAGEYGKDFKGKITLSQFVDLKTGDWIYNREYIAPSNRSE